MNGRALTAQQTLITSVETLIMGVQDEQGGKLWLGLIGIVLVGLALGVGHNAMQRAAGPRHGLAWIKREVKLMSLEGLAEAATGDSATVDTLAAAAGAASSSPAASDTATHTTATRDTTHAKAPSKGAKPTTKDGKPVPAATAATTVPAKPAVPTTSAPTPAVADIPTVPDTREPLEAHLASIRKLYDAGVTTIVDARSPEEYAEGHISGAVSMPFDEVFKDPDKVKTLVTHGRPVIVTYCGGGDCDLSRNLAFSLIDAGHKKVLVFLEGYPGWKDSGAPVTIGTAVGTAP